MNNKNYELYKKHGVDIWNMICDLCDRMPRLPNPLFPTEEERKVWKQEADAFLEKERPTLIKNIKDLGFNIRE